MAGIPKRRAGERRSGYRLRCVHAENTRRVPALVDAAEKRLDEELQRHAKAMDEIKAELSRSYRANPGTKYDRTARKKR